MSKAVSDLIFFYLLSIGFFLGFATFNHQSVYLIVLLIAPSIILFADLYFKIVLGCLFIGTAIFLFRIGNISQELFSFSLLYYCVILGSSIVNKNLHKLAYITVYLIVSVLPFLLSNILLDTAVIERQITAYTSLFNYIYWGEIPWGLPLLLAVFPFIFKSK